MLDHSSTPPAFPKARLLLRLKKAAPLLGLLVLPFLFYWKLFAWSPEERKIFRGDFLNQHFVWKSYSLERIGHGELPLWNPHVLGGVALHANPQVGLFYPPNYLLLFFHRNGRVSYMALEVFQLLHQALAGIGLWLLLRSLGLGLLGAWTGAVVSMFTGFFTTPGHHALVLTAGWIPLNLYLVGRALESVTKRSLAGLAVGLCMMLLAGHPQPAYYGLLLISAWAWYRGGWRGALRRTAPALGLAVGMAAVQLIPTAQLARDSSREGAGYAYATTFEFSPYFLSAALVPRGQIPLAGKDPSTPLQIYVGIGGVLLAGIGLMGSRRRERWFFAVAAAVALLLSFGSFSFLFDMAYHFLAGFSRFRIPARVLGLYALALSVLAGMGMDALVSSTRRMRRRLRPVVEAGFGLALLLAAWSATVHTRLVISPGTLGPRQVERLVAGVNWALVLVVLNMVCLMALLWRSGRAWPAWTLTALLLVDLGSFVKDRAQHPYRTLVRSEERPMHRLARAQSYRCRYVTDTNLESYAMLHGTEFAGGQDSLVDGRYAELLARSRTSANVLALLNVKFVVRATPISKFPWCGPRFPSPLPLIEIPSGLAPLTLTLLPTVEARSLRIDWSTVGGAGGGASIQINARRPAELTLHPFDVSFEQTERIRRITLRLAPGAPAIRLDRIEIDGSPIGLLTDFIDAGGIKVNLHALPRAYFVVGSRDGLEPTRFQDVRCWTPLDPVEVTEPRTGETWSGYFRNGIVRIVRYEPEKVELEVDSPRAGFVVLADTYRPGWRVTVDGKEARVLRAHRALRAVRVDAGAHRIVFSYRPTSLVVGASLSLVCLLAALGLGLHRSRPPAVPAAPVRHAG